MAPPEGPGEGALGGLMLTSNRRRASAGRARWLLRLRNHPLPGVLAVAAGRLGEEALTEWMAERLRPAADDAA